jgi:hypothetical protein
MMIQRIALYATLGLVVDSLEASAQGWQFWSIIALFAAAEWLASYEAAELTEAHWEKTINQALDGLRQANSIIDSLRKELQETNNKDTA